MLPLPQAHDIAGAINFWISPNGWAVELLRDGLDAAAHSARHCGNAGGGRYPASKALVLLDFRTAPSAMPPSACHVRFAADCSSAVLQAPGAHAPWALPLAP